MKNPSFFQALSLSIILSSCSSIPSESLKQQEQKADAEIIVGSTVWMQKNLAVDTFLNGDSIPLAAAKSDWIAAALKRKPAYCLYKNDSANGAKFGYLYNWYAVNDPRGLAPKGWKIASIENWNDLVALNGGKSMAGPALRDTVERWFMDNGSTNISGFSAKPAGGRNDLGVFFSGDRYAHWWTATEHDSLNAKSIILNGVSTTIMIDGANKKGAGFSVRCVKN